MFRYVSFRSLLGILFRGKGILQESPQVLVWEAILRTGSRETARPLSALWLQLLRAVRKRRFNSAAADASWFDLARGLWLTANCTVNAILSKVKIVLVFVFNKLLVWQYGTISIISGAYKYIQKRFYAFEHHVNNTFNTWMTTKPVPYTTLEGHAIPFPSSTAKFHDIASHCMK